MTKQTTYQYGISDCKACLGKGKFENQVMPTDIQFQLTNFKSYLKYIQGVCLACNGSGIISLIYTKQVLDLDDTSEFGSNETIN